MGRSEFIVAMEDLETRSRQLGADLTDTISTMRIELRSAILKLYEELRDQRSRKLRVLSVATGLQTEVRGVDSFQLASKLVDIQSSGAYFATCLKVLDGLTFEQREYRHTKICIAHPATFEWVFSAKFKAWFQSKQPIFWISGKPGSGKSTLMKFLVDNPATSALMQSWSGSQRVATASYFFWINGNELQRSQEGLLQALLYDILRQFPDIIQSVVPDAWEASEISSARHTNPTFLWSRGALLKAFERLASLEIVDCKICIFVDGLDEYEGDHDDLIEIIRYLTKMNAKICIASRPWNVFEDAFGQDAEFKVYLQDFNQHDIRIYVNDKLKKHPGFKNLRASTAEADGIATEIIEKSKGVFLWVFLVVRSLIEGLRNSDRLSQLRVRLRQFPSDLDQFFRHMFLSMDQTYRTQTAHMFQVALSTLEPPSPLTYWYLDEEEDHPDIAMSMQIKAITPKDFEAKTEEVYRRVNGRCKGLLEVTNRYPTGFRRFQVDFLHRTVKDFFLTTELQVLLREWQKSGFDASLAICRASLAELKVIATASPTEAPSVMLPVRNFFHAAQCYEKTAKKSPLTCLTLGPYMAELERIMDKHVRMYSIQLAEYPSDRWPYATFIEAAIVNNLGLYTQSSLKTMGTNFSQAQKRQLLQHNPTLGNTRLTPDTMLLILANGPKIAIDHDLQEHVAEHLKVLDAAALAVTMKRMSELASFATRKNDGVESDKLRILLERTLSEDQLNDVWRTMRRANRAHKSVLRRLWR